jgi:type I restriction enzyme M protein
LVEEGEAVQRPAYALIAGGSVDIAPVAPEVLEKVVRRAHGVIWAGGRRDPLVAFDEWSKLVFAKVWDERMTPIGSARGFQVGTGESPQQVADRVRSLFAEAVSADASIFGNTSLDLPDDKVAEVVRILANISFRRTDLDVIGAAFEHFFSSVFRGALGQYFTRRELVRFVCAVLQVKPTDWVLDPTAGSGGFLLEALIQGWQYIEKAFASSPDREDLKRDFAGNRVFGIEIHRTLGHVCQTNLLIHKDGRTNVEVDQSCLDNVFSRLEFINEGRFTLIVGNPPFGDKINRSDCRDHLGAARPDDFELFKGSSVASEKLILEKSAKHFLAPGGRLAMVVPDGVLNNPGEGSVDPALRRLLLREGAPYAIVSLPDFAFRKSGAQNKTSLLFYRKFDKLEKRQASAYINRRLCADFDDRGMADLSAEEQGALLADLHKQLGTRVLLAEAESIGYNPAGRRVEENQLYAIDAEARVKYDEPGTVLAEVRRFLRSPERYAGSASPACAGMSVADLVLAHPTNRWDPKYHVFRAIEQLEAPPPGFNRIRLGDVLHRREEGVQPAEFPDEYFVTIRLGQDGTMSPRAAGKGRNPPDWYGVYFRPGTWYRVHGGDVVLSRIDIWKGAVGVAPMSFHRAIVTNEFPVYRVAEEQVDPRFLQLLLRSPYWRRAIRSITTGHSNRRRTHEADFENLEIFLPDPATQCRVADLVANENVALRSASERLKGVLGGVAHLLNGDIGIAELDSIVSSGGAELKAFVAEVDRMVIEDATLVGSGDDDEGMTE